MWALRSVLFHLSCALAIRADSIPSIPAASCPFFFFRLVLTLRGFAATEALTSRIASWMSRSVMCAYQTPRVGIAANSAIPTR